MKRLAQILLLLAVVLVLALTGLALWLRSGGALHWALSEAQQRTGGKLTIGSSEGNLNRAVLTGVHWDSPPLHATIDRLTLEWRPVALGVGSMHLSTVTAEGVHVDIIPTGGPSKPLAFPIRPPALPRLPVTIALGNVQARDIHISLGPDLPPLELDSLTFRGTLGRGTVDVHDLDAEVPGASVQGEATLDGNHGYALDATLDWRYTLPGWAPFQGRTQLKGDERSLGVRQTLAAPYNTDLSGTLQEAFTAPHWTGNLRVTRLALAAAHPGWPQFTAGTQLTFRGGLEGTLLRGGATASGAPVGNLSAHFDGNLDRRTLDLHAFTLRPESGGELDLKGSLGLDAQQRISLEGNWTDLALPPAAPKVRSPRGQFTLQGDRAAMRAKLSGTLSPQAAIRADLQLARTGSRAWTLRADAQGLKGYASALPREWMKSLLPEGEWQLAAHGDDGTGYLDRLTGRWLGGTLAANGSYRRADGQWRAQAQVQGADPGRLARPWRGSRVNALLHANGELGSRHMQLRLDSLNGTLRSSPLAARGEAELSGTRLRKLAVDVTLGDDVLHADTDTRNADSLRWRVDAPSLAQAWPNMAGELHSAGTLNVATHLTLANFTLDMKHFAWRRWQADALQLQAEADERGAAQVRLSGARLLVPGVRIHTLQAQADGSLEQHRVQVDLTADRGELHVAGDGRWDGARWQAKLDKVDVLPAGAGTWHAASAWTLALGPHQLDLPLACLAQDQAQACAGLDVAATGWKAQGSLKALPLNALQAMLPAGLEYSGTLEANMTASGGEKNHRLDLDARLSSGGIANTLNGHRYMLLAYTGGEAHLHSNTKLTTGHVDWKLTDGGSLAADVRIAGGGHKLSGRIHGDMHDFELVPALLPQVSQAKGRLGLDVTLAGSAENPLFSGNAAFSDGEVTVPRLGLHMTGLQLKLLGDGNKLRVEGFAHSGDGDLGLSADASRNQGTWHVRGRVDGSNFRSVDVPEAQVDLSPSLGFAVDGRTLRLDGSVTVPHALLKPRDLAGSVQVSPDQVIVGEEGGLPNEKWHVHSRVRVIMGDDVSFDGFGLSGRVGGEVLAVDEPGHVTTGSGELSIEDGQYAAYAQRLNIEYGRLMFTGGPIADPALDIRAVRAPSHPEPLQPGATEQKVGVVVRGTLREPLMHLFSDPPLSQAQATNYLLFGTVGVEGGGGSSLSTPGVVTAGSLSSNSNASANQDQTPTFSLPLGGGNASTDVGVQNVQNGTNTSRSLVVGKYLSPRLYVSYIQGINDPFHFLRFIYTLSTKWVLQAQAGAANSADIIYTLEH